MKPALIAFAVLLFSFPAIAGEEGGDHGETKPPPKPLTGSPVAAVEELPIFKQWKKAQNTRQSHMTAWAESLNEIDGHKCWQVGVGEQSYDGVHAWRRFCVPQDGGDILVESVTTKDKQDATYTPYPKWVTDCKPTDTSKGSC